MAVAARSFGTSEKGKGVKEEPSPPRSIKKEDAKPTKESLLKETLKEATGTTGKAHRSNAEELINKRGVIKVNGLLAVCDGGGGSLGHPVEYITLNLQKDVPAVCKYCGLKYVMDHDHDHH